MLPCQDPYINKHVTRTLRATDTDKSAEGVLTRTNAHNLKVDRNPYPDGPEKNAPQDTPHALKIRNSRDIESTNTSQVLELAALHYAAKASKTTAH